VSQPDHQPGDRGSHPPCRRTSSSPQKACQKLKDELELLSTEKRREVAERIKEAREFGDISENSEYDDAKNEQAMLESRIAQLQEKLRMATVIEAKDLSTDVVQVGSVVHVKDEKTGKSVKYTIVGSAEAKPAEHKLSNESPVGRALLGHKRNETVAVKVPRGPRASSRSPRSTSASSRLAAMSGAEPRSVPGMTEPARRGDRSTRHGLDELIAERRAKASACAKGRSSAFPHAFAGVEPIAEILARLRAPGAGEETDERHRVAGRIAARRGAGKMAFLDLVDRTGKIQLHARVDVLGPERLRAADHARPRRPDRRRRRACAAAAASCRCAWRLSDARQGAAPAARQAPRPHRRRDPLPPPRARPDRQRGDAQAVHRPRAHHLGGARLPRRAGFIEVETPVLQPLYGGAWRARSRPTTTRSTATCTCGSPPSCTSSA
jgi:transcription elongation factor GreA